MVVRKDELHSLIERLQEPDQKTAFDFLQYLIERSERKPMSWEEINRQGPDDKPLTAEEIRQLKSNAGYVFAIGSRGDIYK